MFQWLRSSSSTSGLTFGDAARAAAGNYAGMLAYNHSNEVFTYSQLVVQNAKFKLIPLVKYYQVPTMHRT